MNPNINQNVQLMDILGQLTDRVMGPKNNPTFLGGVAQGLYESPGYMMGMVEGMRDIGLGRARPQYGPTLMGLGEQMGGYQVPDQGPASIGRAMGRNMLSVGAGVGEYIRQQGGGGLAQFAGELAGDTFTGNPRALAAIPILLRGVPDVVSKAAIMVGDDIFTGVSHLQAAEKAIEAGAFSDLISARTLEEAVRNGELDIVLDDIELSSGFQTESGQFLTRDEVEELTDGSRYAEEMFDEAIDYHRSFPPHYFEKSVPDTDSVNMDIDWGAPHYREIYDAQVETPDFEIVETGVSDDVREWFIEDLSKRPDGYDESGFLVYDDADNIVSWTSNKDAAKKVIENASRR